MSHKTALHRKKFSGPVQWYLKVGLIPKIRTRGLDFGCGHGYDADNLGFEKFDPHWFPKMPRGKFSIVLCTYVLCILDHRKRAEALERILSKMKKDGRALIAVRGDIRGTVVGRGCLQREVHLTPDPIRDNRQFRAWVFSHEQLTELLESNKVSQRILSG